MPEIEIRPATQTDLDEMLSINHGYTSTHVMQMDLTQDVSTIGVTFRNVRLPRAVRVNYPRSGENLIHSWSQTNSTFVGCIGKEIVAYIGLEELEATGVVKVRDIVVRESKRRLGIASGMLLASEDWAARRRDRMILLEIQARNNPGISLARKLGYQFTGYQDHYFPNADMALFFSKLIR